MKKIPDAPKHGNKYSCAVLALKVKPIEVIAELLSRGDAVQHAGWGMAGPIMKLHPTVASEWAEV